MYYSSAFPCAIVTLKVSFFVAPNRIATYYSTFTSLIGATLFSKHFFPTNLGLLRETFSQLRRYLLVLNSRSKRPDENQNEGHFQSDQTTTNLLQSRRTRRCADFFLPQSAVNISVATLIMIVVPVPFFLFAIFDLREGVIHSLSLCKRYKHLVTCHLRKSIKIYVLGLIRR